MAKNKDKQNDGNQEAEQQQSTQQQPEKQQPDNSADGSAEQQQPVTGQEKVFTQADVDKIAGSTRKQAISKFAKELGLNDEASLRAIIEAKQEADEAKKSELQKAKDARQAAEQKAEKAIQKANDKLIRAAFLAEAGKVHAQHPQDAYLLADLSLIEIGNDDSITGVENAVKSLVESGRLTTTGKPQSPNLDGGAGSGERQQDKSIKLSQEEIEQAKKLGVSLEDYQKHKT